MTTRRVYWCMGSLATVVALTLATIAFAQVVKQGSAGADKHKGIARHSDQDAKRVKASDLIGMDVRGREGDDKIGSINDVVLGQDGRIEYVAVSFGGMLGLGDKLFAVPFEAIDFAKTENGAYARVDATEETLKQKQGFKTDKWPAEADRSFANGKLHTEMRGARNTR